MVDLEITATLYYHFLFLFNIHANFISDVYYEDFPAYTIDFSHMLPALFHFIPETGRVYTGILRFFVFVCISFSFSHLYALCLVRSARGMIVIHVYKT